MNTLSKEKTNPKLTLYRGKRKDTEEWIESYNINSQKDTRGNNHFYLGLKVYSVSYPQQVTVEWVEVIPETIGRWTGYYDSYNCREKIFEGDYIECETCKPDGQPTTVNYWITDVSDFETMMFLDVGCNRFKLLGNIFDNPKLIDFKNDTSDNSPFDEDDIQILMDMNSDDSKKKIWFRAGMEAEITSEEMNELLIYSGQLSGESNRSKAYCIMKKLIKNGKLLGETYILGKNTGGADEYDNPDEEITFEF